MRWFTSLSSIKIALILSGIAFVLGITAGYQARHTIEKANALDAVKQTEELSVKSIDKSNQIELKSEDKKDQIEIKYQTITKEIVKYVPQTTTDHCVDNFGNRVSTTLSADAVRVLNDTSAEPSDVQPANIQQGEAATEVGLRELSEHIVTIKKQYEDLAVEHDGLIEYNDYYRGLISQ